MRSVPMIRLSAFLAVLALWLCTPMASQAQGLTRLCVPAYNAQTGAMSCVEVTAATPLPVTGGGGGGGGAVTIADGADVTQGSKGDSQCATPSSSCSNNSILRSIFATAASTTSINQSTPGVTNGVFVTNGLATATGISTLLPNNTTPVVVRNVAATLWYGHITGIAAAPVYVKFYDNASACSGTIRYRLTLPVASTAANAAGDIPALPTGITFSNGITYCATTDITDTNSGAPTASQAILNYGYN